MLLNHYGHVAVRGVEDTPENAVLQEDLIGVRPYFRLKCNATNNNWGRTPPIRLGPFRSAAQPWLDAAVGTYGEFGQKRRVAQPPLTLQGGFDCLVDCGAVTRV